MKKSKIFLTILTASLLSVTLFTTAVSAQGESYIASRNANAEPVESSPNLGDAKTEYLIKISQWFASANTVSQFEKKMMLPDKAKAGLYIQSFSYLRAMVNMYPSEAIVNVIGKPKYDLLSDFISRNKDDRDYWTDFHNAIGDADYKSLEDDLRTANSYIYGGNYKLGLVAGEFKEISDNLKRIDLKTREMVLDAGFDKQREWDMIYKQDILLINLTGKLERVYGVNNSKVSTIYIDAGDVFSPEALASIVGHELTHTLTPELNEQGAVYYEREFVNKFHLTDLRQKEENVVKEFEYLCEILGVDETTFYNMAMYGKIGQRFNEVMTEMNPQGKTPVFGFRSYALLSKEANAWYHYSVSVSIPTNTYIKTIGRAKFATGQINYFLSQAASLAQAGVKANITGAHQFFYDPEEYFKLMM